MKKNIFLFIIAIVCIVISAIRLKPSWLNQPGKIRLAFSLLFHKAVCYKCNVVVLSIDSLRADELPCYGYQRDTAPNICQFAKSNILFENAQSNSNWTMPSEFSIFTSLYPSVHLMRKEGLGNLSPSIVPLPEWLQKHGYATVYVGFTDHAHMPLNKGIGRGFDTFQKNTWDIEGLPKGLEILKQNTKVNKPTFLFAHIYTVHAPFIPGNQSKRLFTEDYFPNIPLTRDDFFTMYKDFPQYVLDSLESYIQLSDLGTYITPGITNDRIVYNQMLQTHDPDTFKELFNRLSSFERFNILGARWFKSIDKNDPKIVRYIQALYDERIYQLDQSLQQLFTFLSDPQIKQNTIVIITSDHGEEFMEHGELEHGQNLFNTSIHVPLIFSVPEIKPQRSDTLVQSIDIYPTILGLVGLNKPRWIGGIDLTNQLLGKSDAQTNNFLISEFKRDSHLRSIRSQRWKIFIDEQSDPKITDLYDLFADPREQVNLVQQHPYIENFLYNNLQNILQKQPIFSNADLPVSNTDTTQKQ